jgi:hypothetical protein
MLKFYNDIGDCVKDNEGLHKGDNIGIKERRKHLLFMGRKHLKFDE